MGEAPSEELPLTETIRPPVTQPQQPGPVKGLLRALVGGPVTNWHGGHQGGQSQACRKGTWDLGEKRQLGSVASWSADLRGKG